MNPSAAPFLPDGTVYGTLLNFRHEQALWAARATEPPYKAPPQAPVLFIKTANTFSAQGAAISLPADVPEVEVGASLGLVIANFESPFLAHPSVEWSHSAINIEASAGLPRVAGCVLLNDLSVPHDSYYRPPVKFKCLDGFLGIGPRCVPLAEVGDIHALTLEVRINGALRQTVDFSGLVRHAATLLADVNAFMTLRPGDVLMLGSDCLADGTRPRARAGDRIEISAPGFAPLVNTLVGESA
ncbi:MAG: fumarylacetoacetate hydrolase family protein [Betaproteobacteria bacterium]|nr:fumarylacetoacetate hydrolase family protein [Betaproteobacteria bacterium]